MPEKTKTFLQNLILLLISLGVTAVLAELLLRAVLPPPIVWKYPQESYVSDPEIGHWLTPNQSAYTHDKPVNTNTVGLRDSEFDPEPVPGMMRILALGDSQTFGNGLLQSETWPKQLELQLNRKGDGRQFEVLNSGLPGSDTWQHEIILRRMLAIYKPDAVVLGFYVNDVVKKPAGTIASGRNTRDPIKTRLIYLSKQSALLLMLRNAWNAGQQLWSPSAGFMLQNLVVEGKQNPLIADRWKQVDQSLSEMKRLTDEAGIPFFVVSLPRRDQVDGRISAEEYTQRLEEIADSIGIPLITVLEPLQQSYSKHGKALFIPWDGHNSMIANQVVAGELAARLLEYDGIDR